MLLSRYHWALPIKPSNLNILANLASLDMSDPWAAAFWILIALVAGRILLFGVN